MSPMRALITGSSERVQALSKAFEQAGAEAVTLADIGLVAGDSFYAPGDVPHGVRAIEAGTLIDVFTPIRDEFLV